MLLSDRQRIIKATNSNFKNEDFSSCKSDKNVQLEKVKSDNLNQLSQYLSKLQEIHLQAAKHILHYLEEAINLEILYKTDRENLIIFADAFYTNACKFKSTTDFCALILNEPVI